jgi:YidC/Oxa1 family membrane protein insertase
MSYIITAFNEVFFRPLFNALVLLTNILPLHDLGFAVIILTILVRLALFPFTHHSVKAQVKMRSLEPHIQKIREDHKDNQEELAKRTMALYKEHGVNPFSGCLMLIIQLPLLIALYQVFLVDMNNSAPYLYSFISAPKTLQTIFLGVINLAESSIFLAATAALTQFIQMKLAMPATQSAQAKPRALASQKPDFSRMMTTQMTYVMPGIIFIIGLQFSAAISLYWTTMNIFAIIHEMIVRRKAETLIVHESRDTTSESTSS